MLEDRGPMVLVAEALLLGRVTYEGFTGAWPSWDDEAGYADEMNGMPKYVASTTLRELEWSNSTLLEGDVADVVARLKLGDGGDILVTVQTLMEHDLVDEYRLMVFPVVLGRGRRPSRRRGRDDPPAAGRFAGLRVGRRDPHVPAGPAQ